MAEEGGDWSEGEQNFIISYCPKVAEGGDLPKGEQNFVIGYLGIA